MNYFPLINSSISGGLLSCQSFCSAFAKEVRQDLYAPWEGMPPIAQEADGTLSSYEKKSRKIKLAAKTAQLFFASTLFGIAIKCLIKNLASAHVAQQAAGIVVISLQIFQLLSSAVEFYRTSYIYLKESSIHHSESERDWDYSFSLLSRAQHLTIHAISLLGLAALGGMRFFFTGGMLTFGLMLSTFCFKVYHRHFIKKIASLKDIELGSKKLAYMDLVKKAEIPSNQPWKYFELNTDSPRLILDISGDKEVKFDLTIKWVISRNVQTLTTGPHFNEAEIYDLQQANPFMQINCKNFNFEKLRDFFKAEKETDIVFFVGDKEIKAHRFVFASFTGCDLRGLTKDQKVKIEGMEAQEFSAILEQLYLGIAIAEDIEKLKALKTSISQPMFAGDYRADYLQILFDNTKNPDQFAPDFKLVIGKQVYHVHKAILRAASVYFDTSLNVSMLETNTATTELKVPQELGEEFLKILYTGKSTLELDQESFEAFEYLLSAESNSHLKRVMEMAYAKNLLESIVVSGTETLSSLTKIVSDLFFKKYSILYHTLNFKLSHLYRANLSILSDKEARLKIYDNSEKLDLSNMEDHPQVNTVEILPKTLTPQTIKQLQTYSKKYHQKHQKKLRFTSEMDDLFSKEKRNFHPATFRDALFFSSFEVGSETCWADNKSIYL